MNITTDAIIIVKLGQRDHRVGYCTDVKYKGKTKQVRGVFDEQEDAWRAGIAKALQMGATIKKEVK